MEIGIDYDWEGECPQCGILMRAEDHKERDD
jgi:hypothetical protein